MLKFTVSFLSLTALNIFAMMYGESPLGEAIPNPFNPITAITYNVDQGSYGSLAIFSSDGRLVLSRQVFGQGQYPWNASHVASGIYLCQLRVNNKTYSQKLILKK